MDPKIFLQCFMEWTELVSKIVKCGVVAIDGKTMRGTADELNGKKALHIVSAWFSETGMVLGQVNPSIDLLMFPLLILTFHIYLQTIFDYNNQ